ncbi:MAG: PD40 domain-containing protein [Bacteroidales bacterium]|nr:PD40 domain-containing protein [Bacteroidales bacterium]
MKNIKKYFVFFTFSLMFSLVYSQNVEFSKDNFQNNKDGLKEALINIEDGDYYCEMSGAAFALAIPHYLKANTFNPNNALLNYKIGNCYLLASIKENALEYFETAYSLNSKVMPDILLKIAAAHHYKLQFDKAIEFYGKYLESLSPSDFSSNETKIKKHISECETGKSLVANPVNVEIKNLGEKINTEYPEHSPLVTADESMLIFTSRRNTTLGGGKDPNDMQYYEDIYISHNINSDWGNPINPENPVNSSDHDATVGLSPDGQRLFIYKGKKNRGDIYWVKLRGDEWQNPKKLPENVNTVFHESSACFSPDDKRIYFVSDRLENNYGGRDIYYIEKQENDSWSNAINIGKTINTDLDEDCVFMHPDGKTLYFSSTGHNGMGGYDIFKSKLQDDGSWSAPQNIGFPINSPDDDVFFVMSASGKHGYFSAYKKDGMGDKDIYRVDFLPNKKEELSLVTIVKGIVSDQVSGKPIEAKIEIIDNEKNEIIATFYSNSSSGKYLVSLPSGKNYGIIVAAEKYLFHSENFNLPKEQGFEEIIKNINLKSLSEGSSVVLNNIFFDYASARLSTESFPELDRIVKLMNQNPSMQIEIGGHTDNQSSLATNQKLSEDRAKSVVDYLILEGVDKQRLSYKGYAFHKPIADNNTEEGKAKNRRVEFKIISK